MTEKRYNVWDIDGTIFLEDHKEGSYHIGQVGNVDINCLNDIANLLNNLSEDNEYLEKRFKEEEWHYDHIDEDRDVWMYKCQELEKENEKLKKDCSNLIDDNTEYVSEINQMHKENEELKKELSEYKDFVLSDDKILCYTCLFCTHKGIYEVDCDVKGHVDVHGTCHSYTKKELQK